MSAVTHDFSKASPFAHGWPWPQMEWMNDTGLSYQGMTQFTISNTTAFATRWPIGLYPSGFAGDVNKIGLYLTNGFGGTNYSITLTNRRTGALVTSGFVTIGSTKTYYEFSFATTLTVAMNDLILTELNDPYKQESEEFPGDVFDPPPITGFLAPKAFNLPWSRPNAVTNKNPSLHCPIKLFCTDATIKARLGACLPIKDYINKAALISGSEVAIGNRIYLPYNVEVCGIYFLGTPSLAAHPTTVHLTDESGTSIGTVNVVHDAARAAIVGPSGIPYAPPNWNFIQFSSVISLAKEQWIRVYLTAASGQTINLRLWEAFSAQDMADYFASGDVAQYIEDTGSGFATTASKRALLGLLCSKVTIGSGLVGATWGAGDANEGENVIWGVGDTHAGEQVTL